MQTGVVLHFFYICKIERLYKQNLKPNIYEALYFNRLWSTIIPILLFL